VTLDQALEARAVYRARERDMIAATS